MGEVYLAEDTTLDRKVALKILPADVASNRDRMEAFRLEGQSVAALNHPNIAHIYEIGDSEGTPSSRWSTSTASRSAKKIHHSREPLSALLGYLGQVAEGLAKAHHAGIVHRDLKPDNVMITRRLRQDSRFRLAKLVESPGCPASTRRIERTIEACRSWRAGARHDRTCRPSKPADASTRSIIDPTSSSLGCLLFEAATGQKAFEGKDALDSWDKIVANAAGEGHQPRSRPRRCSV